MCLFGGVGSTLVANTIYEYVVAKYRSIHEDYNDTYYGT